MESTPEYLLLQITDTLFPIGGYAHSFGLETYVQADLVRDVETAYAWLESTIRFGWRHTELLAAHLAWDMGAGEDVDSLLSLEETLLASRSPRELRTADQKLGSRFCKTLRALSIPCRTGTFFAYAEQSDAPLYAVAFGACCGDVGIPRGEAMRRFLFCQASAAVTNCVKLIPLSQTAGQQLLYRCYPLLEQALEGLENLGEGDLCRSMPGSDIRSMQHERLYSRLYLS